MPMSVWHPEAPNRVALEIELDQNHRLTPDHPAVMAGFDGDNLRRPVLHDTAIRVLDVNLAADEKPDMRVHAEVGPDDGFHVDRPSESWRIDHPFDPRLACFSNFKTHVANFSKVGAFYCRQG